MPTGPFHRGDRTDPRAPLLADLGEVIREHEGRAGPVGAAHHRDRLRRQLRARIELAQRGVIPRPDLAEEDSRQGRTVQRDVAALDSFDVHDRNDAAHHGRELHEPMFVQVRGIERHVGRAEGHLLVLDLLDAVARSDRPIGDADTGLLFVGVGPFRVDRKRKGGAGAGNVGRDGGTDRGRGKAPGGREHLQEASGHGDRGIRVGKTSAGMEPGNRPIAECPRRPCKRCYGCMIIS